jgi:hypothetical protein
LSSFILQTVLRAIDYLTFLWKNRLNAGSFKNLPAPAMRSDFDQCHCNLVCNSINVHLNMSERENGQLPLAKRTMRSRISADVWEQIKTAYASGIGLRELGRNMGVPAGTVLARAKREGWSKQIVEAKALAKRQDAPLAVTPIQAVSALIHQRGERHIECMAGVSECGVDHVEKMAGNEILTSIDEIEKLDRVARRTFGLSDGGLRDNNLIVNVALLGIDPATVQVRSTDGEG